MNSLTDRCNKPSLHMCFETDQDFWTSSEMLKYLQDYAVHYQLPRWGFLGAVLARVSASYLPSVTIPNFIGTELGNLNYFVMLCGNPGTGKGQCINASETLFHDVFNLENVPQNSVGTGEGLAKAIETNQGEGKPNLLIRVDEVTKLTALASRQGSTILSTLCSAFSGETLEFLNASKEARYSVARDTYRLALTIGAQPANLGEILEDKETGTPQRFIYMPLQDVTDKTVDKLPSPPPQKMQAVTGSTLEFPNWVRKEIEAEYEKRKQHALTVTFDAHRSYLLVKTAALLALLQGTVTVTNLHMQQAGHLLHVSDRCRKQCEAAVKKSREEASTGRFETSFAARANAEDSVESARYNKLRKKLFYKIKAGNEKLGGEAWPVPNEKPGSSFFVNLSPRQKREGRTVYFDLLEEGLVEEISSPEGVKVIVPEGVEFPES